MPRILVVVHTLFRGGAEVSTMETHRELKRLGCEQFLLNIYAGDEGFHTMLREEAQEVFDVYTEYKMADKARIAEIVRDFAIMYNPDIVMYSLLREVPDSLLTIPDRMPCIQVMHSELGDSLWGNHPIGTDAVITVSRQMAENAEQNLNVPHENLYPIWNGIDPQRIRKGKSLRAKLKIPGKADVVGMVGNLNDLKRPLLGLEAFAAKRFPNSHMIFAGNDSDQGNEVRARIKELGLGEYVHILGLVDNVEDVFATINIMLNCSTMEGLPMTIVEAMFANVAVIASHVGGNPEIVHHNETGLLFNPDDHEGLGANLSRLIRNRPFRKRLADAAYERACKTFTIETVGKQYMDVIKKYTIFPDDLACSVVMPVYNGEEWLDRAIWSVRRQTMPYFEFIIIDDGSTDNSANIIKKHRERDRRIKFISAQHGGIVKALNTGIAESSTPLIARMDADDEMTPDRLQVQMDFIREHPYYDVIGSQMLGRSADGNDMGPMAEMPLSHEDIEAAISTRNPMCHPTVIFKKAAFRRVGGYKGDGRCEDYRLWTDMMVAGCRFVNMEEALLIYQHTHADDNSYAAWRDSVLQEIQSNYIERKVAMANG
jgi:glycosyltransferase involved in cell wall biosynthesis